MTIENLEKELKMGKLNSIYLLYGEELYLLESNLKRIRNLFGECIKGINYIMIDEQNVPEIISDIETPSFGYEKKLIIARNTGLFKKEGKKKSGDLYKLKEKLINYINENLKKNKNVIIMTENNLDNTVNKVLENVNLAKEDKERITKINWKNNDLDKFKEVKKASKDGKDTLIFVKGKENYIENMNRNIENWINNSDVKVVDCYDINEIKEDASNIEKNYTKILSTSGVVTVNSLHNYPMVGRKTRKQ